MEDSTDILGIVVDPRQGGGSSPSEHSHRACSHLFGLLSKHVTSQGTEIKHHILPARSPVLLVLSDLVKNSLWGISL